MPIRAKPCRAIICHTVPGRGISCRIVSNRTMPYCAMLCRACAVPYSALPRHAVPHHTVPYYAKLCRATPCLTKLRLAMPYHALPCCAVLYLCRALLPCHAMPSSTLCQGANVSHICDAAASGAAPAIARCGSRLPQRHASARLQHSCIRVHNSCPASCSTSPRYAKWFVMLQPAALRFSHRL